MASEDIKIVLRFGPWGADVGEQFDDGEKNLGVKRMEIAYDDHKINGIRSLFRDDSCSGEVWSPWHGNNEGKIGTAGFPNENINSIRGVSRNNGECGVIKSLTINSDNFESGPFGDPKIENEFDEAFEIVLNDYKVLGLFGRAHTTGLTQLGVIAIKKA